MEKLKVLDLFSGIGGFSLGLERTGGFETVAFCEIEKFPQKVLKKHWPNVPIYEDVRELNGQEITKRHGRIDLICGGYPCQPFSVAGKREGKKDDRHLWPEVSRLLDELRPRWFIGENVIGHISMGLDDVLSDLEAKEYTARTFVIPACAVNAPHKRERVWIVAHSEGERSASNNYRREQGEVGKQEQIKFGRSGSGENVADTYSKRGCGGNSGRKDASDVGKPSGRKRDDTRRMEFWDVEPDVGRVANGVPGRVDRLKGLGNAVLPQIPELIGNAILEEEKKNERRSNRASTQPSKVKR